MFDRETDLLAYLNTNLKNSIVQFIDVKVKFSIVRTLVIKSKKKPVLLDNTDFVKYSDKKCLSLACENNIHNDSKLKKCSNDDRSINSCPNNIFVENVNLNLSDKHKAISCSMDSSDNYLYKTNLEQDLSTHSSKYGISANYYTKKVHSSSSNNSVKESFKNNNNEKSCEVAGIGAKNKNGVDHSNKKESPPAVLIHGLFGGVFSWTEFCVQVAKFLDNFDSIYIPELLFSSKDLRSFKAWCKNKETPDILSTQVKILHSWTCKLNLSTINIITFGSGSVIASHYVSMFSNNVEKLILVEPSGFEELPYVLKLPMLKNNDWFSFHDVKLWYLQKLNIIFVTLTFLWLSIVCWFGKLFLIKHIISFIVHVISMIQKKFLFNSYPKMNDHINKLTRTTKLMLYELESLVKNFWIKKNVLKKNYLFGIWPEKTIETLLTSIKSKHYPFLHIIYGENTFIDIKYAYKLKYKLPSQYLCIHILDEHYHILQSFPSKRLCSLLATILHKNSKNDYRSNEMTNDHTEIIKQNSKFNNGSDFMTGDNLNEVNENFQKIAPSMDALNTTENVIIK